MRLTLALSLIFIPVGALASVQTYFNHRGAVSYQDPFRGVVREGDDLEAVIIQEIEKAKTSVFVAVQEIRLPAIAKKLAEKHKAGVDVRVVLENSYNHNVMAQPSLPQQGEPETHESTRYRDLVKLVDINGDGKVSRQEMSERDAVFILQQAKVPLIDDTEDGTAGSGLMHHKFVIVDGKSVVISSANFTPSCIHGDVGVAQSRGNANALMVVKSAPLAKIFNEEFQLLWDAKFGGFKPFRGARTVTVAGKKITVQFSPSSRTVAWDVTTNGLIAKTLKTAKTSIKAALFVFSDQQLVNAMQGPVTKGAELEVLVESKFAFRSYSEVLDLLGVSVPDVNCNIEPGNAPWRPAIKTAGQSSMTPGDVLHHKFGVVDNRKVIFGSHNWSDAANLTNDEFLVVVDDTLIASEFAQEFERVRSHSRYGLPANVRSSISQQNQSCKPLQF